MGESKDNASCTRLKKLAAAFSIVALLLLAGAALTPPMWFIDGSIIGAVGEIFAFVALFYAWEATDRGIDAKIKIRDTEIELNNPDKKE